MLMAMRYYIHCNIYPFFVILIFVLFLAPNVAAFSDARFDNSTDKGNFGEDVTDEVMKKQGYEKLPSKHAGNQGIDRVYVRYGKNDQGEQIVLVESKTDSSPYNEKQMSGEKIREQIEKMKKSRDPEVRKTGELLEKNPDKLQKELHRHNSRTGKTTIFVLDKDGKIKEVKAVFNMERVMRKLLAKKKKQQRVTEKNQNQTNADPITSKGEEALASPVKKTQQVVAKVTESATKTAQRAVEKIAPHSESVLSEIVVPLKKAGKVAGKLAAPVQIGILAYEAGKVGMQLSHNEAVDARDLGRAAASTVGGFVTTYPGAFGGAAIGTIICPGPGTVVGGIVGGLVTGVGGAIMAEYAFDVVYDISTDKIAE